ncbi:MAG: DUF4838 domain-containing protein [Lentisphaeria bacterium]|nr:DUF4838 domain-containing protein [Lentisphaeria bacterium]
MKHGFLCAALAALVIPASAEELTLAQNGKTDYKIVIAEKSAKQVKFAAEELSSFLKQMTGAEFPVVTDRTAKGKYEIVLGETNRNAEIPAELKPAVHEGFTLLVQGKSIQIRGKIARGTLYGVYDFLDEKLGVRFLSFDCTYVPKKPTLKISLASYKYDPPYDYRNIISTNDPGDSERLFMVRQRLNSCWGSVPLGEKIGGLKHLGGFVHNLHKLMPQKKYFKDHPEYFAFRAGARRAKQYPTGRFESLPCLTNPEVKTIIEAEIRRILDAYYKSKTADPDDQIFFPIDYHDHDQVCQCEKCQKVNEEEGCRGGTLFRFLNAVSDDLAKDYPNVIFSTLAYGPTIKPGKTPLRKNIIIRYAPIRMDNARSLDDPKSPVNLQQLEYLKGWLAAGTRFYVWYYVSNFNEHIIPHADLKGIEMNFPLLHKLGMKGMFVETSQAAGIEMKELRAYVISSILWRPEKNARKLVEEFCHLYYGKGGGKVLEYIDMLHDYHYNVVDRNRDNPLTLRGAPPYRHAYTIEFITKADKILYDAEKLAETKQEKLRVAVMHMPMWYLRLTRAMNTERQVLAFPSVWRFKTDPDKKVKPQDDSSKWGTIRTDDFWTKQEPYTKYYGSAWYAVDFDLDEKLKNDDLSLFFSAVDGAVVAYIDGKKVGATDTNSWNQGFYLHLPEKLQPGRHELKVKVTKDRSAAGIWKPVALLNMAQKLSEETRTAGERFMETELTFVPKRRKPKFRITTFERINTLLKDEKMPVTSLTDGAVTKFAHILTNVHKTFKAVDDPGALTRRCVEQLPAKKWTLGQSINYGITEILSKNKKAAYRVRVRVKVKKKGNAGNGLQIGFCYYNKGSWSGGSCTPPLLVPLKDLPDNEWTWIEYPHQLKFKDGVKSQMVSVKADHNPKNLEYLLVDAFEVRPDRAPTDGKVRFYAKDFPNEHKTFRKVKDAGAEQKQCAEQLPKRKWTLGQTIQCPVSDIFDDVEKIKTFRARVRIKAKKKGNEGAAAVFGFSFYNQGSWSGGDCTPPLQIQLKDLPDNEWTWVEYPHVLKYKDGVRYQLLNISAAFNPKNLASLRVDSFEIRPANP